MISGKRECGCSELYPSLVLIWTTSRQVHKVDWSRGSLETHFQHSVLSPLLFSPALSIIWWCFIPRIQTKRARDSILPWSSSKYATSQRHLFVVVHLCYSYYPRLFSFFNSSCLPLMQRRKCRWSWCHQIRTHGPNSYRISGSSFTRRPKATGWVTIFSSSLETYMFSSSFPLISLCSFCHQLVSRMPTCIFRRVSLI